MLKWLNEYIGLDWATYIGLFLALIALFGFGARKTPKKKIVQQEVKIINGMSIQAGRDVRVENVDKTDRGNN